MIQSQDLSAQSVELATPLTDRLLFADLLSAYNAELDRQCFRASGASGELLGINQFSGINAVGPASWHRRSKPARTAGSALIASAAPAELISPPEQAPAGWQ